MRGQRHPSIHPRPPWRRLRARPWLALVVVGLAGCRKPPRIPAWTAADAGPVAPLPPRSAGCTLGDPPIPTRTFTLRIDGVDRRYAVQPPAPDRGRAPLPVLFFFHGKVSLDQPPNPRGRVSLAVAALREASRGSFFVEPEGTVFPHERVRGWDQSCDGADMKFFQAMLAEIEARFCVDPRAVFVSGFSWGADMANALACCHGELIRAIAPASGAEIGFNPVCPAGKLPAFRLTYADNDWFYKEAEFDASIAFFRRAHGCAKGADPLAGASCVVYRGCAQPVVACRYPRMGHAIPPGFGPAIWTFFDGLAR